MVWLQWSLQISKNVLNVNLIIKQFVSKHPYLGTNSFRRHQVSVTVYTPGIATTWTQSWCELFTQECT